MGGTVEKEVTKPGQGIPSEPEGGGFISMDAQASRPVPISEIKDASRSLRRERDESRADFGSAQHDLAPLITAVRDGTCFEDVEELAEECADNGREGWIEEARSLRVTVAVSY